MTPEERKFIVFGFRMTNGHVITPDPTPAQVDGSDGHVVSAALADLEASFVEGGLLHMKQDGHSIGINTRHVVSVDIDVVRSTPRVAG